LLNACAFWKRDSGDFSSAVATTSSIAEGRLSAETCDGGRGVSLQMLYAIISGEPRNGRSPVSNS
jgi:hypothetical protein